MPAARRPAAEAPAAVLDGLLAALRANGGLPAVGHTLARLTRLLESDSDAVPVLADVILSDLALTQRLLRIANTLPYRVGPQAVTTVTRAIMLLGFDQVRSVALSVVLIEGLLGGRAGELREELHRSLLAGSLARELLQGSAAEEAAIAAMFRGVGRLLVAVFAPQAARRIRALARDERLTEAAAARRVLGRSHDELTAMALRDWGLPERIQAAVQPLPARLDGAAGEPVRVAAQFAEAVAAALDAAPAPDAPPALDAVLARFQPVLAIDRERLLLLVERAAARTRDFEIAFGMAPGASPVARLRDALPAGTELGSAMVETSARRDEVGRPANACTVLAAGLAEATDCLARGERADLNSVIQVTLEAMFTGLGYARTALVLREPATGLYRTRAGFGEPKARFSFTAAGGTHLFAAALLQGKDLHIADSTADKLRASLPDWFLRDFGQARSFLLMPLVVADKPVGFFYADRPVADAAGLSAEELNLLRALRSQVVLAMRSR